VVAQGCGERTEAAQRSLAKGYEDGLKGLPRDPVKAKYCMIGPRPENEKNENIFIVKRITP